MYYPVIEFTSMGTNFSRIVLLIMLVFRSWASTPTAEPSFEYRTISELKVLTGVEITLKMKGEVAGCMRYIRIPCTSIAVFYDFYIQPAWRRQGLGALLGKVALKKACEDNGVQYIVIQPGPFELSGDRSSCSPLDPHERARRLGMLVETYQRHGFKLYSSPALAKLLRLMYRIMGINEDSSLLMIGDVRVLLEH